MTGWGTYMNKKHLAISILALAIAGLSVQSISAQVQKSKAISQWDELKPKIQESAPDSGDQKLIDFLRGKAISLMEDRAALSNVDSATAQRTDLDSDPEVAEDVEQRVSKVWTSRNLKNRTADIIAGWNIAKLDPNYIPFKKAAYLLDSWQGIQVSEDGLSANVVITGTMTYVYDVHTVSDSKDQTQIKLVNENGVWLLDDTVAVFTGESNR
jgi:hypothetical protein